MFNFSSEDLTPFYGHALLDLSEALPKTVDSDSRPSRLQVPLKKSVSAEMQQLFSDAIELSLTYDAAQGKLSLGITQAKLSAFSSARRRLDEIAGSSAFLYAKVTLLEGRRLIKAKKTRPVGFCRRPQFHETFSILFPSEYLSRVSCVISLCCKNRQGAKIVLGRLWIGPEGYAEGRGLQHWNRMTQNMGATVIQWHH